MLPRLGISQDMSRKFCVCFTLRCWTLISGIVSLIVSMSLISATLASLLHYGQARNTLQVLFLVNGIVHLPSSILCIQGACAESKNFLLPWIFLGSIGIIWMYIISISYMIIGFREYVLIGIFLLLLAVFFSGGWVCVMSYYYYLSEREYNSRRTRNCHRSSSVPPTIIADAPPSYAEVYIKEQMSKEEPPSYEEISVINLETQINRTNNTTCV